MNFDDMKSNLINLWSATKIERKVGRSVLLMSAALSVGIIGSPPTFAHSTSGYDWTPGNALALGVSDNQGTRTINYVWTNQTGSTKCVTAFQWYKGNPSPLEATHTVLPNAQINFHNTNGYSGYADATIEFYSCTTGVTVFRYLIGAGNNPNVWLSTPGTWEP